MLLPTSGTRISKNISVVGDRRIESFHNCIDSRLDLEIVLLNCFQLLRRLSGPHRSLFRLACVEQCHLKVVEYRRRLPVDGHIFVDASQRILVLA
jgi:hypothetical protein